MTFPDPAAARPSFGRYWLAAAVSAIGTAVTAVAMPVLVVQTLAATPLQVGIVNAAQFVPYAVLGLIAGAYTDRWRRKPTLVWASLGRAVSLGAIPLLWLLGVLEIWMLVALLLAFGACSVFGFAATQSLLPRLVPRTRLVTANARLDQADAAAQTLGPAVGGGLVGWLGAPVAIAVGDGTALLVIALVLHGLAAGVENTHEMSLRQAVTPDELLGRVNSNIRSANRTAAAVGALLGGIAVGLVGDSGALAGVVALFAVAAIIAAASPLRAA